MRQKLEVLTQRGVFQCFFENYPDGICILDPDGYFLDANPAALRISGYTYEELLKISIIEFLDSAVDSQTRYDMNFTTPIETMIRHKRGHLIYVKIVGIPMVIDGLTMGMFILLEDITRQREQRKELLDIQEMFSFISEKSQNIISSLSADGVFTYISPTVEALLGYAPEEVIGKSAFTFNHPDDNVQLLIFHNSLSSDQDMARFTGRVRHKNGEYRWYETTAQYIRDESGVIIQTIGVGRDITDRKEAEETIAHLAYHDTLTELPNRRLFRKQVSLVFENSEQERHGLILLDLDGFKYVNDTFGHNIGDLLLIEVGKRLTHAIREQDIVARLGGDEFTILQTNIDHNGDLPRLTEQIKDVIAKPIIIEGHTLYVTASIGAAFYPTDGDSVEMLMRNADVAMYRAKNKEKISFE